MILYWRGKPTIIGFEELLHLDVWVLKFFLLLAARSLVRMFVISFIQIDFILWVILSLLLHKLEVVVAQGPL